MPADSARRPATVVVAGLALLATALVSGCFGLLVTMVSNCCGSPEPPDRGPAILGITVAGCLALAAFGLMAGWMGRWLVLALTAAAPVTCFAAAPVSSDLGALAPVALLAWGAFAWFLRRPVPRAWLDRDQRPV